MTISSLRMGSMCIPFIGEGSYFQYMVSNAARIFDIQHELIRTGGQETEAFQALYDDVYIVHLSSCIRSLIEVAGCIALLATNILTPWIGIPAIGVFSIALGEEGSKMMRSKEDLKQSMMAIPVSDEARQMARQFA